MNISIIKEFIEEIITAENINKADLYNGGAIYYMNGNDGTDFDFQANNRSCEFYVFWNNEKGAIKAMFEKGGIKAWCYFDKDNAFNSEKIHTHSKTADIDLLTVCEYLQGTFDDKNIFDEAVTDWELTERGYISTDDEEDEEYYEEEYDEEDED